MSKRFDIPFSQLSNMLVAIACALACGCPLPAAVISACVELAHSSGVANGTSRLRRVSSNNCELNRDRTH